jgi:hypothetical protein
MYERRFKIEDVCSVGRAKALLSYLFYRTFPGIAIEDTGQEFARAWLARAVVVPVAMRWDEGLVVGPGVEAFINAKRFG